MPFDPVAYSIRTTIILIRPTYLTDWSQYLYGFWQKGKIRGYSAQAWKETIWSSLDPFQ